MLPRLLRPLVWPLRWKLLAVVLAALGLAMVPLIAALTAFSSLLSIHQRIEESAARMHAADELLGLVFDGQSAQRGYVLTGDPHLLGTFETAMRELPEKSRSLVDAVAGDPLQASRARHATDLARRWRSEVAEPIVRGRHAVAGLAAEDPRSRAMVDAIAHRIGLGEGSRLTDEIRWVLGELERSERDRLSAARNANAARRRSLLLLVAGGLPLALITGTLASLLLARRATRSLDALARAADEVESGNLPTPIVYQGRDELTWLARAFNRMIESEARRRREREALSELSHLLQSSVSIDEATDVVRSVAPSLIGEASGGLYLYGPSRNELELATAFGDDAELVRSHFAPHDCWAVRLAKPHRRATAATPACAHADAGEASTVCVPLGAHGEIFGLLHCRLPLGAKAADAGDRLAAAEALGESLAVQLAAVRLRETLRGQSIRDPLTGVYNRRFFDETFERELRRAERQRTPLSLLLLDLDHFKRFNDDFGHEAGDLVLRELGALLQQIFRAGDLPCRLGGEEFAVLMPDADVDAVRHRVHELATRLRNRELRLRKQKLNPVTLSAGLAGYPVHGSTAPELLRAADEALYAAKHAGRDRLEIAC